MCEIDLNNLEYFSNLNLDLTEVQEHAAMVCDTMIKDKIVEAKNNNDIKLLNKYKNNGLIDLFNQEYISYDDEIDSERAEIVINDYSQYFYKSDIREINKGLEKARINLENYEDFVNGCCGVSDTIIDLKESNEILYVKAIIDQPVFWIKVCNDVTNNIFWICISDVKIDNLKPFNFGDKLIEFPTSITDVKEYTIKESKEV